MTEKKDERATRDLYEDLPEGFNHYVVDEPGPNDSDNRPSRVIRGVITTLRPRGGSRVFHQTLRGRNTVERLNFRQAGPEVGIHPIHASDLPLALLQLSLDLEESPIVCDCERVMPQGTKEPMEIDPGWVELYGNFVGAVYSGPGWPSWDEDWYLPTGVYNLENFTGTVYDKGSSYSPAANLIKWKHTVNALTGTYEGEAADGTWFVVRSNTVKVAVIHQIVLTDGSSYVDTWWLSSNFTWWGNGDNQASVTKCTKAQADGYRAEFNATFRYKHAITKP